MRGSHHSNTSCLTANGIIPAHAGLTRALAARTTTTRDHPRACGAHSCNTLYFIVSSGSSPRMRGSLRHNDEHARQSGIIPAHAGLTGPHTLASTLGRDHPRACGAHPMEFSNLQVGEGSSPRMRGSHERHRLMPHDAGIIPAHAGLTRPRDQPGRPPRDHPRACGAHRWKATRADCSPGSSPRMRGSRRGTHRHESGWGIIPAHAGLTVQVHRSQSDSQDHPRACGAHFSLACTRHRMVGSSPRMRGSH